MVVCADVSGKTPTVWALVYTFVSLGIGYVATRIFRFPAWTTPAVAFNNTTSLPLVLVQSLAATGILSRLIMSGDDSTSAAILRAKSYFLVNSTVGNAATFALGPKLLDGDEAPDAPEDEGKDQARDPGPPREPRDEEEDAVDEQTSLLPDAFNRRVDQVGQASRQPAHQAWQGLPPWLQTTLSYLYDFLVAPLIGAIIGTVIGLAPPLRQIFFNKPNSGGYFNATITSSVKNVGDLFAALQLVVVGSKLSGSLRNMKEGKDSGSVPWAPMLFVFFVRFILWPLYVCSHTFSFSDGPFLSGGRRIDQAGGCGSCRISIPIIWLLATKTSLLGNDPILWFCLMMMPTGPPAIKLTALADVNDSSEHEKMSIAKFLTVSFFFFNVYKRRHHQTGTGG